MQAENERLRADCKTLSTALLDYKTSYQQADALNKSYEQKLQALQTESSERSASLQTTSQKLDELGKQSEILKAETQTLSSSLNSTRNELNLTKAWAYGATGAVAVLAVIELVHFFAR